MDRSSAGERIADLSSVRRSQQSQPVRRAPNEDPRRSGIPRSGGTIPFPSLDRERMRFDVMLLRVACVERKATSCELHINPDRDACELLCSPLFVRVAPRANGTRASGSSR